MKVELLTGRAGVNYSQAPGEEIEVSEAEGRRLIQSGQAVPVQEEREKATRQKREER